MSFARAWHACALHSLQTHLCKLIKVFLSALPALSPLPPPHTHTPLTLTSHPAPPPPSQPHQVSRQLLPALVSLATDADPQVCGAGMAAAAEVFRAYPADHAMQEALMGECLATQPRNSRTLISASVSLDRPAPAAAPAAPCRPTGMVDFYEL